MGIQYFAMHEIQRKILELAGQLNLGRLTLREIGSRIGEQSAQKIKHHLMQLERHGLLKINKEQRLIEKIETKTVSGLLKNAQLLRIPVVGAANAGPALSFADHNIESYLTVSSTLLGKWSQRRLFALKVDGSSMNRAEIDGKKLEDGDYVIVDGENHVPKNGDIVLSVIGGLANIKKLRVDREHEQILLISESTSNIPPIYIHASDEFHINGVVIQVVKRPR